MGFLVSGEGSQERTLSVQPACLGGRVEAAGDSPSPGVHSHIGPGLTCVQWGWSLQRTLLDDCPQGAPPPPAALAFGGDWKALS